MEITRENNERNKTSFFDPTPSLKSSPVPILFIPFNQSQEECNNCKTKFSMTIFNKQKFCKNCLTWYTKYLTDDNLIYLDVLIKSKSDAQRSDSGTVFYTRYIQKWGEDRWEISYFRQIIDGEFEYHRKQNTLDKDCGNYLDEDLNSDCYLISSGWIESTLFKKSIPILYLPWWDNSNKCIICRKGLKNITDCQKWCPNCFIIYTGCRYCLTTNIIFGITKRSQCKKCKRFLSVNINIKNLVSGNHNVDEFLDFTRSNINNNQQIANYIKDLNENSDPLKLYIFIRNKIWKHSSKPRMEWIPYFQITSLERVAEGGFAIVYKADKLNPITNRNQTVAIKRFLNSENISKPFLNEVIIPSNLTFIKYLLPIFAKLI